MVNRLAHAARLHSSRLSARYLRVRYGPIEYGHAQGLVRCPGEHNSGDEQSRKRDSTGPSTARAHLPEVRVSEGVH